MKPTVRPTKMVSSLCLCPEAGKYSMRVEVPGMLANLALEPIHFELKNPR